MFLKMALAVISLPISIEARPGSTYPRPEVVLCCVWRPRNGHRDVPAVENHLENPQSCRDVFFLLSCASVRGTDPQREMLEAAAAATARSSAFRETESCESARRRVSRQQFEASPELEQIAATAHLPPWRSWTPAAWAPSSDWSACRPPGG